MNGAPLRTLVGEDGLEVLQPREANKEVVRSCPTDGNTVLRDAVVLEQMVEHRRRCNRRSGAEDEGQQRGGKGILGRL
jgi:hypothetical protein